MGAQGTTTVDFGAFPGKSDATATVTGQAAIVSGSLVEAWMRLVATADHSADEHWVETIQIDAGNISAGVGFTIYARNTSELNEPIVSLMGGKGTRLYGLWTVNWAWN